MSSHAISGEAGPAVGDLVARRYRLEAAWGEGTGGRVFRARDALFGRAVALKVMRSAEPGAAEAFRREFSRLAGLFHPHLLQVHDFGVLPRAAGAFFFTADLVDGQPLDRFAAGRPATEVIAVAADIVRALSFLHRHGIRHNDLCPANVLVTDRGHATVVDLGCAGDAQTEPTDVLSGTPGFIAPERRRGERADVRADLYSFGRTLERALAGATTPVPASIRALLDGLTAEAPHDRPLDAAEVLEQLGSRPEAVPIDLRGPFVGRDALLATVERALDALAEGRTSPRILWLVGREGAGLSRALSEIKWRAQLRFETTEGIARAPGGLRELVRRATGLSALEDDPGAAIVARDAVIAMGPATVVVLDDVDQLSARERAILDAMLRLSEPDDPFVLVVASHDEPVVAPAVMRLGLSPLDQDAVARWVGPALADHERDALYRATGGWPGEIAEALADRGSQTSDALQPTEDTRRAAFDRLDRTEREALGWVALAGGRANAGELARRFGSEVVSALRQRRWIVAEGDAIQLTRAGDRDRVEAALSPAERRALHRALAANLCLPERSETINARVIHLCGAGSTEAAAELLAHRDAIEAEPGAFVGAAAAVADLDAADLAEPAAQLVDERILAARLLAARLLAAETLTRAGEPRRALPALARARRADGGDLRARFEIYLAASSAQRKLGDPRRALQHLSRARRLLLSPVTADANVGAGADNMDHTARLEEATARTRLLDGHGREAASHARAGLVALERTSGEHASGEHASGEHASGERASARRAALSMIEGAGLAYTGDTAAARAILAGVVEAELSSRDAVRLASYRAIAEYRSGDLGTAEGHYRHALAIASDEGITDQIPSVAMNLGTLQHRRGLYGQALETYGRALRYARAIGKVRTELAVTFNMAQAHADTGSLDRAATLAETLERDATAAGSSFFAAAAGMLRGEVASFTGRTAEARVCFTDARARFEALGAQREVLDLDLLSAELALEDDVDPAPHELRALVARAVAIDADDLGSRAALLFGRALARRGELREAVVALEQAREGSARLWLQDLGAEAAAHLAHAYHALGADHAARASWRAAVEPWDRMAATLEPSARDGFFGHPRRRLVAPTTMGATASANASVDAGSEARPIVGRETGPTARERLLERVVAVNARLSQSLDAQGVVAFAMDAAIELTGAERGFLLLTDASTGEIAVAQARNVDRERVDRAYERFSRTVAERVMATGEPIVTVDAENDERFAHERSIQAQRLRSIVSVPIQVPGATGHDTLGALYLDNRFSPGLFDGTAVRDLLAFADQVAIALHNAALYDELTKERERIARLLSDRTQEVDRLSRELRLGATRSGSAPTRQALVGRSAPMRGLFAALDRLRDSSVTVLVQGESGTGKELVARAIHGESSRADAPFVSVNCAALPEALLEAELFGHERGAFTGADRSREGLFVLAGRGTLFLDEIGELPLGVQAKLLRALQEREVRPLGASSALPIEARIVCATNRALRDEVRAGRFREDLYYRLAVIELEVAPLRERSEDIVLIARHLVGRIAKELGRDAPALGPDAARRLMAYRWPGNVRQLENALTNALVLGARDSVEVNDLVLPDDGPLDEPALEGGLFREPPFEQREAIEIRGCLESNRWNVSEVARVLGIPRATLYRKLKRYGLTRAADEHRTGGP